MFLSIVLFIFLSFIGKVASASTEPLPTSCPSTKICPRSYGAIYNIYEDQQYTSVKRDYRTGLTFEALQKVDDDNGDGEQSQSELFPDFMTINLLLSYSERMTG